MLLAVLLHLPLMVAHGHTMVIRATMDPCETKLQ